MNNKRAFKILVGMLFFIIYQPIKAQQTFLPINSFSNFYVDRLDISGQTTGFNTSLKPISRGDIYKRKPASSENITTANANRYFNTELFEYPVRDTSKSKQNVEDAISPWKGFKRRIYFTPMALYSQKIPDFTLIINPVLGLAAGNDFASNMNTSQVSAGAELRGMIDSKVGFYSILTKNWFQFPGYINDIIDSTKVVPGEGYHTNSAGEHFFKARGYITFSATKHIGIQFGHDRNFIGNGYRSLILSANSKEYLFLKVNTKVWRISYQNLFTQISDYTKQSATGKGIKPKYFVNHYLGIKLFKNLDIGLFESVIFDRGDSSKKGRFEFNYLNPIIFYTAIENNLNSSDNVIIGGDWKWNFKKRFSFYGQLVLDEFVKDSIIKRTKWWANKYAWQAGLKYINAFSLNGLDLQVEYNSVRPYTYTHFKPSQNYVNYNQALAHPFGANFREAIFILRYQPVYKLFVEAGFIYVMKGLDSSSANYHFGGNIFDSYLKRPYESNHFIGQGVKTKYSIFFINVSWMICHNLWIDARCNLRTVKSSLQKFDATSQWFQLGVRMNLNMRNYDY